MRLLEEDGWYLDRTKGSHRQFMLFNVPGAKSSDGLPATVTTPGLVRCLSAGLRSDRLHRRGNGARNSRCNPLSHRWPSPSRPLGSDADHNLRLPRSVTFD